MEILYEIIVRTEAPDVAQLAGAYVFSDPVCA